VFEDARAASRQARSLRRVGHRPFPLPESRWTLGQTWEQTFWAHWPVPAAEVRRRVPDELEIEEHGGSAWLGIMVFRVRALRARGALPLPGISSFLQLNVRTYVRGPDRDSRFDHDPLGIEDDLLAARGLQRDPADAG